MFGFNKDKNEKKVLVKRNQNNLSNGQPSGSSKKGLIIKSVILLVILGLISYGLYVYIESVKEKAYIDGGDDAISMIKEAALSSGGVEIEMDGQAITLSTYYKPIGKEIIEKQKEKKSESENSATSSSSTENNETNSTSS